MKHPYKDIPDFQFWRKAISNVETFKIDPVTDTKFKISRQSKVSTAGSCFAQHISQRLSSIGFNYFVAETDASLSESERRLRNFGVFSARYGNLYTARQLLQLFEEVFEGRTRTQVAWQRPDGKYVDPLRPNIEPAGFETIAEVIDARSQHLERVKAMFLETDIFIFTLGLTETWQELSSGEVYPLAPGVVAGDFDEEIYGFINFNVAEVTADLEKFLNKLKVINPDIQVILTVSPVPLIATYEQRHVLVSTAYSKSVLRVAAEDVMQNRDWIDYFPSYEIITGNFSLGKYFEDDLREVNSIGVDHAMRCFLKNYIPDESALSASNPLLPATADVFSQTGEASVLNSKGIVCDEEAIARINI